MLRWPIMLRLWHLLIRITPTRTVTLPTRIPCIQATATIARIFIRLFITTHTSATGPAIRIMDTVRAIRTTVTAPAIHLIAIEAVIEITASHLSRRVMVVFMQAFLPRDSAAASLPPMLEVTIPRSPPCGQVVGSPPSIMAVCQAVVGTDSQGR